MEKRLILAIILSILVLVGFQFIFELPVEENKFEDSGGKLKSQKVVEKPKPKLEDEGIELPLKLKQAESLYSLETEKLYLKFSNVDGQIKEVYLKDYYKTEQEKVPLPLLTITSSQPGIGKIIFGDDIQKPRIWKVKPGDKSISFSLPIKKDFKITKKFTIASPYSIILSISVENKGETAQEWEYSVFGTSNIFRGTGRLDKRYSNMVISYNKDKLNKISLSKVKKGLTEEPGDFEWIAEKSRYFSMIFAPETKMVSSIFYRGPNEFVASGAKSRPCVIRANDEKEHIYHLYLGPNDMEELESFKPGCQNIVDFGIWSPISIFLLKILKFINLLVNNYGVSIMCLTVIINLFLFPLTRKSFRSMKKMQDLQPLINKLREEHKDNPQKLNKELMALYKTQGGNPLGGCFPMLLQFPIFISLYLALTKSIELKGANFLWISDLARPDAAFRLPFSLPFIGAKINMLPILMLVAMIIQQRISQARTPIQAGSQKQLGMIMPIVFGFIFYHFPSGVVLYWLTNTIIMGFVQWRMLSSRGLESENTHE